jgi:hypothetical protein
VKLGKSNEEETYCVHRAVIESVSIAPKNVSCSGDESSCRGDLKLGDGTRHTKDLWPSRRWGYVTELAAEVTGEGKRMLWTARIEDTLNWRWAVYLSMKEDQ